MSILDAVILATPIAIVVAFYTIARAFPRDPRHG